MAKQIITLGIGAMNSLTSFITTGLEIGAVAIVTSDERVAFIPYRDKRAEIKFRDKRAIP